MTDTPPDKAELEWARLGEAWLALWQAEADAHTEVATENGVLRKRMQEAASALKMGLPDVALAALAEEEPKRLLPWDEYVKKVRAATKESP